MHGQSAFQSMHAASIFRDVATDGVGSMQGGHQRMVEVEGGLCLGNGGL